MSIEVSDVCSGNLTSRAIVVRRRVEGLGIIAEKTRARAVERWHTFLSMSAVTVCGAEIVGGEKQPRQEQKGRIVVRPVYHCIVHLTGDFAGEINRYKTEYT